jgi:tetratricopeptide (TPR) repeat protein
LLIFAVAFAVRLVHVWQMRDTPFFGALMGDARGYDAWAQEIAAGDWLGSRVFYQAPLYPYFLGVSYWLFGRDLLILRIGQAVVGSLACVLAGVAGWRLFSRPAGLAAGLALALYAPAIFFDGLIQKSVLDVFFVCAALALVGHAAGRPSRLVVFLALGAIAGCLSLTRENALLLVAVFGAWVLVGQRSQDGRSGRGAGAGRRAAIVAFAIGVAVVLLPVVMRNRAVDGGFYLTTAQFGPNLYIGNNPRADGTYASLRFGRGSPEYERTDATELAERAVGRRLTPAEVSRYWSGRAVDFLIAEPGRWLRLQARKAALLVNADEMLDTESQESHAEWSWPLRLLGPIMHFGVLVPLAVLGVCLTWTARARVWVLYAVGLTYALGTLLFYVFARYRYPLVPVLILFAAAGAIEVWRRLGRAEETGRRSRTRLLMTVSAVAAAAIVANWPMLSATLMRAITETNLGTALYEDGRHTEAEDRYRRAIAIQPDYPPAYNNLGVTLRAGGRVDDAIAIYEEGLRVRPDYPDLHYNLANALLERNRAADAAEHLRIALQTRPDAAAARNNLGRALAESGRLEAAVTELRKAVALDPGSAMARRNLGNALASLGHRDEGLAELRRAVEIDRTDPAALYDLGSLLLETGRTADAAEVLGEASRLAPASAEIQNNLGIAMGSLGKLEEAIGHFEQALRLRPGFLDAQRNLTLAREAGQRARRR